ncbi:hypothetical protein SVIO_052810 [Streptomyces violaceusniger]|uniref:Novel STAND NTPase 1 domain-containing protein n=1 Tax=Streptomyces violaceusniger TaxID=68280 RepID=A0A4D4L821_STRVO|nr:hypothetical protein SVIO_052810 [Streptomyces violaceusniger]
MSSDSGARIAFAERLALLYKEAGNPPLKSVAEAVVRLQRTDERGRPVRVSAQRISDWRRAKNVPAQFAALAAVLHVLIPDARRSRPVPVSPGLYDMARWQRLWERAVADPVGERPAPAAEEEEGPPAEGGPAVPGGVCPYRGLASYRQQDARWFFGRERSTDALVAQLHAAEKTGGLVVLVGASGAGKSSLLNAGLVPALRTGAPGDGDGRARGVTQLVPGADPLAELARHIPELARVVPTAEEPETDEPEPDVPEADADERPADGPPADAPTADAPTANAPTAVTPTLDKPTAHQPSAHEPAAEPGTPQFAHAVREAITAWADRETPSSDARPVVIVDQFEEAFTLGSDEADRRTFIQLLHAACTPAGPGEPPPCSSSSASAPTSTNCAWATPNWPTRSSTGTWCSGR